MNPVYITNNGTDISSTVDKTSISLTSVLTKEVSTLSFNVRKDINDSSITLPVAGDAVKLYDSSGVIFGGTVTQVEKNISGLMLSTKIMCTDYSYLLDGTLVHKNYANADPQDIVIDIINTFAAGKGFTTNSVQRGNFLVPSIKFNYQQPTKCLESLARLIGWDWYIDASKDVHFFLGDVNDGIGENGAAPIIVDTAGGNSGSDIFWNSLSIDNNLQNMQNSCYVIGGNYSKTFTSTTTPDTYQTDGITQVFTLAYAYSTADISVTLAGVSKTVGIDGKDDPSTVDVLYNDVNRNIKFTAGAPTTGQTVKIFGKATVPIVAHASDASSVATYGEYQSVIKDSKITTVSEAQARATAAVLQFGHLVDTVTFTTLVPGCKIGQAIYINLPTFGVQKWLVIKRVEAQLYAPGTNGKLQYTVECIGSDSVTFVDIMTTLLQQEAAQTTVDSSTVNQNLELVPAENLSLTETLSASSSPSVVSTWG